MAFQSLAANRARAMLTMLGIIIGVAAVITMTAIGQGAQQVIANQINSMGSNMLQIDPGPTTVGGISSGAGGNIRLSDKDAEALRQSPYLTAIATSVDTRAQVVAGNSNWVTRITGTTPEIMPIRNYSVSSGEMFSDADAKAGRKVCLLGKTVVDNLFGQDADPVGQTIRIKNIPFVVIGLLKAKGANGFGQDQDDNILAPVSTVQRRLMGITWLEDIFVSTISTDMTEVAIQDVTRILRIQHKLTGTGNDFRVRSQVEMAQAAAQSTQTMTDLLRMAAVISLLVGGIGIMNIMLVSVTERTREIGIRKSIGAKKMNILTQFLTEAVTLSLIGGVLGVILGYAASSFVSAQNGWNLIISPQAVGLSFAAATAVGVFFGWYPAMKAARLNPIEALRYE